MRLLTKLILILFIVKMIVFLGITVFPITNQSLIFRFLGTSSTKVSNISVIERANLIFIHNWILVMLDAIPLFGLIFMVISTVITGIILNSFAISEDVPTYIASLRLLLYAHSWIELPTYAIASAVGIYLMIKPEEWKRGLLTLSITPLWLYFAALIESYEFTAKDFYISWIYGLPLLIAVIMIYVIIQRISDKIIKMEKLKEIDISLSSLVIDTLKIRAKKHDTITTMDIYWYFTLKSIEEVAKKRFQVKPKSLDEYRSILSAIDVQLVKYFDEAYKILSLKDIARFPQYKDYVIRINMTLNEYKNRI